MDYWPSVKSRWMDIGQAKKEWGQYSSTLPQQAYLNLWKKNTLVEHGGKSQAGKIVPSWPLRKPITVQGLVYLSCSWSHNVQLQKITIPPWKVFHFNPPSTWNFHSRGVCEDPPPLRNSIFSLPSFQNPLEVPSHFTGGKLMAHTGTINSFSYFSMLFQKLQTVKAGDTLEHHTMVWPVP